MTRGCMHLKKRPIRSARGVEGTREVGGTRAALSTLGHTRL